MITSRSRFLVASVALGVAGGSALAFAGTAASGADQGPPLVRAEVPVTPMDLGLGQANNSPLLVADPAQPRFVVLANRVDAPDFSCGLQASGDSGRSWITIDPIPELPEGADKCYGPEVAFGPDGTLYYLFIGLHGAGNEPMGAFLTTSSDRGQTFTPPRQVLGPLNFGVRMAIAQGASRRGRLHLAWLHATSDPPLGGFGPPPNPILAAHSDDGGATFSEPVQVSDEERSRVVAPALALGPDRAVHVGYYDLGDDAVDYQGLEGSTWEGTWSLVVATSTDAGRTFSRGSVVDAGIVPTERVMLIFTMPPASLAAGPGRRVCAAWTDARHGDGDALARCSRNRGRTWGPLRRLNDDRTGNGVPQSLPRLAVAPGGRLDATFLDRRHDPQYVRYDVMYTSSADGVTFARNLKLTNEPSNSRIGARFPLVPSAQGLVEMGSRLGLLSHRHQAVAAWPDSRNSVGGAEDAQDIFAATVAHPRRQGGPGWLRPLGIALLAASAVAGTAGLGLGRRRSQTLAVSMVVGMSLSACRQPEPSGHPLPPRPPVVEIVMGAPDEYAFTVPPAIPAGRVVFRIRNGGRLEHHLDLLPLPEDLPPLGEQLRGPTRVGARPFAATAVRPPGATSTFAVDLRQGIRYGIVCFVQDPDGQSHAVRGMSAEFRPN